MKSFVLVTLAAALISAGAAQAGEREPAPVRAIAKITGCTDANITGTAWLRERPSAEGVKLVDIKLKVTGLPEAEGKRAVHIHEAGQCTPCSAALGHFDPGTYGNSTPPDANHPFHSGDLVNLEVKDGVGRMKTTSSRITLSPGPLSVFDANGSSFIVHVAEDTYCPNGPTAGCAGGARAACGVIEMVTDPGDEGYADD